MPHLSSLVVIFVSVVCLDSLVTCRPADTVGFDLVQEDENPPLSDFLLSLNDEFMEEPPQLPESSFGSTEPLLLTSFSGPINTASSLDSDFDPTSPPDDVFDPSSFFSSSFSSSSPFSFQIADETLCPGENRFAFCCKGEKCVKTAKCYTDEDLNCCIVDPGEKDDKTPYNCQPPSSPSLQGLQIIPEFPSDFVSEFPSDFDSDLRSDLASDVFSEFPSDFDSDLRSDLPSDFFSKFPSDFDGDFLSVFSSESSSNFPDDSFIDAPQEEPITSY